MNRRFFSSAACVACMLLCLSVFSSGQAPNTGSAEVPEVTRVDDHTIKPILIPNGKPLLVNFWATWCVQCVEEFPLLVEIHEKYKGQIDFITISLDDLAEIKRDVPKFLREQNATMPAFLLYTKDENAVIRAITDTWSGGLPFTVFYSAKGEKLYEKQGIVKKEIIFPAIDAALPVKECNPTDN